MKCVVEDLGLIDYEKAWKIQDEYALEIATGARLPTLDGAVRLKIYFGTNPN